MKPPLECKIEAFLHLGGPSFAILKIAETPLWATDIGLGTCSWIVLLLIMAFGLLQGIAGSLAIACMSKSILRPLREDTVNRGFWGAPGDHNIYDRHVFLCRRDDDARRAASADRARFGFCANAETRRACRPRPRGVAGTTP